MKSASCYITVTNTFWDTKIELCPMQSVPLKILRWLSLVKKYSGLSWRENGVGHKIKRHFIWPHFKRFETNIQGNRLKFHVIRYNYIDLEFFFWGGGGHVHFSQPWGWVRSLLASPFSKSSSPPDLYFLTSPLTCLSSFLLLNIINQLLKENSQCLVILTLVQGNKGQL